jgi:2-methylcitrate dehydratase PrpD
MVCIESKQYSKDYLDPSKRSIANAVQIFFKDGSRTEKIEVEYPLGHRRRREEGIPLLQEKFENNLSTLFNKEQSEKIIDSFADTTNLYKMPVSEFMELFLK